MDRKLEEMYQTQQHGAITIIEHMQYQKEQSTIMVHHG